ncbi:hypothetical protein HPP92_017122 [Vanilla planifolia]|uniref:Uncharacterized protein n=1 Tax=Vanilla planifolia TaxID=51239 RepID=A0A835Q8R2_VANPL|nr:hypothetical protein HPP92_017122 [Vanilla planifolia]
MIAIAPFLRPLCVVSPLYLPFPDFGLQERLLKAHTEIPSKEKRRDSHLPPRVLFFSAYRKGLVMPLEPFGGDAPRRS